MPKFEEPSYLLLTLLLPVAVLLFKGMLRWRRRVLHRMGDEALVRSLLMGYPQRATWIRFLFFSSAFLLTVLGLANMQTPRDTATVQRKGVDVMFALDVSRSMHADDVKPSRLQVAKQMLSRIMERIPDARIGLVLFAGRAYLQMPLTFDRASASAFLAAAGPESVPSQGTAIAESLTMATMAMSTDEKSQKVLFMVTDGEDHEEGIAEAARLIRETGINLMVAGVGTKAGVALKNPETGLVRLDSEGNPVVTRLNEEFLGSLAKETAGLYLGSSETDRVVKGMLGRVDAMEKTPMAAPSEGRYHSHFQWFLGAALLLLLLESIYRDKPAKP